MFRINLDQVTTVVYNYTKISDNIKVVEEGKYFFNLLTRKKHIWVKAFLISHGGDDFLPFSKESVERIVNDKELNVLYQEESEKFVEKAYAYVKVSSGDIKRYYFNTDIELDSFMQQFEKLRLVKRNP